VLRENIVIRAT